MAWVRGSKASLICLNDLSILADWRLIISKTLIHGILLLMVAELHVLRF